MEKRGLTALLNTTPAAGNTVTVNGVEIDLRPVAVMEVLNLIKTYPELKNAVFGMMDGVEPEPAVILQLILDQVPLAIGKIIAISAGEKGNADVEAKIMDRPDDELLTLAEAVIDVTMPKGHEDFFGRFTALARKLGWFGKGQKETREAA